MPLLVNNQITAQPFCNIIYIRAAGASENHWAFFQIVIRQENFTAQVPAETDS